MAQLVTYDYTFFRAYVSLKFIKRVITMHIYKLIVDKQRLMDVDLVYTRAYTN